MLGDSNQLIETKDFGAAGQLKLVKNIRLSYFTPKRKLRLSTKISYSVYFLPRNPEIDLEDHGEFKQKREALKAFRAAVKEWEQFFSVVWETVENQKESNNG